MGTRRLKGVPLVLALALAFGSGGSRADEPGSAKGYAVRKLLLPADILPSCMAVRADGRLAVGSMDGDVLLVKAGGGTTPEHYERWAGTLPHWPLGMLADGNDLLVATRGALIRLADRDGDGWAEHWSTVSDAWDVSSDHHDWTTGIARWPDGGLVVSPVTDDVRTKDIKGRHYLRGKAVKIDAEGKATVLADGLRYPTGWATGTDGKVFFTDNQGQQKTTCEINQLQLGHWYGYASQADRPEGPPGSTRYQPVVRIPYPWARSVNGLAFAQTGGKFGPLEGQLVLCEYNNRFILRASLDEVDGVLQGACYPFIEHLLGPICVAFAPDGSLYVGSLREPAWGGEPEQGAVYQVTYTGQPSPGLQEVKAAPGGFTLTFFTDLDASTATDPARYHVRRYHHVFQGAYHSPPVDEQTLTVAKVEADGKTVRLKLNETLIPDRIYEIRADLPDVHPNIAHYTMNRVPPAPKN